MSDGPSFEDLKKQYFFLDTNFNRLSAACQTDEQRDQLRREYVNARDNFWEARNRAFREDDPLVQSLNEELKDAQNKIEQLLSGEKNIAELLNVIAQAVGLASRLITLGSSV